MPIRVLINLFLIGIVTMLATLPLLIVGRQGFDLSSEPTVFALLNCIGWVGVLNYIFSRIRHRWRIYDIARSLGIDTRFKSFEALLLTLIEEVHRKTQATAVNVTERKILSQKDLSRTLEELVGLAFRLFYAESAEIALFDRESGMYHSSFVLGKPFRTSAQAMLSNAVNGDSEEVSPDVLVQPIAFAGSIMGTLRIGLRKGSIPSTGDREVMRMLALQAGLAILNTQYTEQLLQMRRSSEESIKAKTGFLANLSHEIRGPLGIMLNAVELVLDGLCGEISKDQAETLQMVRSSGEHLLELINDVLDYAKVESGKITPQPADILVDEILKDLMGVVRNQADAKGHKLVFKASEEALAISCDRRHLRQMLINMLTNAIKYTPDGGSIEIWAERMPVGKIKINVKDSGIGIEEADRRKVFAAFERIENSYAINQLGTGLGMSLTRRLAEVNGGLIDFTSRPGKGSHFWVMFPAIKFSPETLIQGKTEKPEARGRGEAVLIIEKDEGERSILVRYLAHLGFKPHGVPSPSVAEEILKNSRIDLAIIDNQSAEGRENEVVPAIRAGARSEKLPVLLLTSRAFVFDIEKYLRAGIDRCLAKPTDLKKLGQVVRELLDGISPEGAVDSSEVDLKGQNKSPARRKSGDITKLLELDDVLN